MSTTADMVAENDRVGYWRVMLLLMLGCNYAIVAINHTLPTFQGYTPHYSCQVDNVSATVQGCVKELNSSVAQGEQSCSQGYKFESERDDQTVVTEWQLICERRFLRPLVATLYFCGVTLGAVICGLLADHYGRRPLILSCLYIQGLLGVSLYFVKSLEIFMAVRFIQGFFVQGLQGTTFALLVEIFPPKSRTAVAVVLELYWALGLIYLAGASYYISHWRPLELVLSIPTAATLIYVCLVPESARWLITRGREEDAQKVWKRILPRNEKNLMTYTNSMKRNLINDELKLSDVDSSNQNETFKRQSVINNSINENCIQIEVNNTCVGSDSLGNGDVDTGAQFLTNEIIDGKNIKKIVRTQELIGELGGNGKDSLKESQNSSLDTDHIQIVSHIIHNENESKENLHGNDGEDNSNRAMLFKDGEVTNVEIKQNANKRTSSFMTENSVDESFDNKTPSQERKENIKTISNLINPRTVMTVGRNDGPCQSDIGSEEIKCEQNKKEPEIRALQLGVCKSNDKNDGLDYLWTEMVPQLSSDEECKSIDEHIKMRRADNTSIHCEKADNEGNNISGRKISKNEGIVVHEVEISERNSINKILICKNTSDISQERDFISNNYRELENDNVVIYSNTANKCKIIEKKTVTCPTKVQETGTSRRAGFMELFKRGVLRKYNMIMAFVWFSVSLSYYGIMFHLPDLSGERHLNFLLGAILEVISYVLAYNILSRLGRRLPMASYLLISGIICIVVGAISVIPEEDTHWIASTRTAMALLGKGTVVSGFCTMFLYASELFPTVLRAAAMGHCGFWGRVGSLIAPQLLFLGEYTLPAVPLVIMGILGMLAGISVLALPETLGQQLPDTVEDIEMLVKK